MIRPIDPELDNAVEDMVSAAVTSSAVLARAKLHCNLVLMLTEKVMERGVVDSMSLATTVAQYTSAIMTATTESFTDVIAAPFGPDEEENGHGHEA